MKSRGFIFSVTLNPEEPCCFSDLQQFLDLSEFQDEVKNGNSFVLAEAFFNAFERQYLNTSNFLLTLAAYTGSIADFNSSNLLVSSTATIAVDNNLMTWEGVYFTLNLPSETTYLRLLMSAFETDMNGEIKPPVEVPLPGAFADDVSVTLFLEKPVAVPEPSSTLGLLICSGYGLFSLLKKRREL